MRFLKNIEQIVRAPNCNPMTYLEKQGEVGGLPPLVRRCNFSDVYTYLKKNIKSVITGIFKSTKYYKSNVILQDKYSGFTRFNSQLQPTIFLLCCGHSQSVLASVNPIHLHTFPQSHNITSGFSFSPFLKLLYHLKIPSPHPLPKLNHYNSSIRTPLGKKVWVQIPPPPLLRNHYQSNQEGKEKLTVK